MTYLNCCMLVDNILTKIYDYYYEHLKNSIHKKKLFKNEFIVDRVNAMTSNYENNNTSYNININNNADIKEERIIMLVKPIKNKSDKIDIIY